MNFSRNIKLLRKRKRRTQDEVAIALNMKRSTLSGYENEVAKPSIEVLIAFADYFNVSVDTLVRVDLESISESMLSQVERGLDVYVKGGKLRVLATTVNSNNVENIELVPLKAKAGYGRGFADPDYIGSLPVFNLPFLPENKKFRTFQISGESMLPIPDGSWITGEFVVDWSTINTGQAGVVCTLDDGLVFKIIENRLDEGYFLLHSLNPEFESYRVEAGEVKEIWSFVNYISNRMPSKSSPQEELLHRMRSLQEEVNNIKQHMENNL